MNKFIWFLTTIAIIHLIYLILIKRKKEMSTKKCLRCGRLVDSNGKYHCNCRVNSFSDYYSNNSSSNYLSNDYSGSYSSYDDSRSYSNSGYDSSSFDSGSSSSDCSSSYDSSSSSGCD